MSKIVSFLKRKIKLPRIFFTILGDEKSYFLGSCFSVIKKNLLFKDLKPYIQVVFSSITEF